MREKRGGYSKLEMPVRSLLREGGLVGQPGGLDDAAFFPPPEDLSTALGLPVRLHGDLQRREPPGPFGAPRAARRAAIEPRASRWFDLRDSRMLEWVFWMVSEAAGSGRALGRPAHLDARSELAMFLLQAAWRAGTSAVDEMFGPARSLRQRAWREAARRKGLQYFEAHACAFGAVQKRPAAFLAANLDLAPVARTCEGYHAHKAAGGLPWGGSLTAWPLFAQAMADVVCSALRRRLLAEGDAPPLKLGYERPAINALADTLPW